MRVRDLVQELTGFDPDAIVITDLPDDEFGEGDCWTCTEVTGVERTSPPFVFLAAERRQ